MYLVTTRRHARARGLHCRAVCSKLHVYSFVSPEDAEYCLSFKLLEIEIAMKSFHDSIPYQALNLTKKSPPSSIGSTAEYDVADEERAAEHSAKHSARYSGRPLSRQIICFIAVASLSLNALLVFVLVRGFGQGEHLLQCLEKTSADRIAPAFEAVELYETNFDNSSMKHTAYRGRPTAELERAWSLIANRERTPYLA